MKIYFCNNGDSVLCTNHLPQVNIDQNRLVFEGIPPVDKLTKHNKCIPVNSDILPRIPARKILAVEI